MRDPTIGSIYDLKLPDLRKLMEDLAYQSENVGAGDPAMGDLLANAHRVIEGLLSEYLAPTS